MKVLQRSQPAKYYYKNLMLRCLKRAETPLLCTSITINKSIDYKTLMQKVLYWTSKGR